MTRDEYMFVVAFVGLTITMYAFPIGKLIWLINQ